MAPPSQSQLRVASFLIRLRWEEANQQCESPLSFHGEIEHIQSGERWILQDLSDLSSLLQTKVAQIRNLQDDDDAVPPTP
ncbi:MAG: hypothetical protein GXP37_00765 [Chloroflexi bacterium]|nr:hypothetical protein [Chloroflexota bacterium]